MLFLMKILSDLVNSCAKEFLECFRKPEFDRKFISVHGLNDDLVEDFAHQLGRKLSDIRVVTSYKEINGKSYNKYGAILEDNGDSTYGYRTQYLMSALISAMVDNATEQYFWQEEPNRLYLDMEMPGPELADDSYFNKLPLSVREGFNRLRWTWRYDTPEKYQHSVKGYYRMIKGIDLEIAKIRSKLQEKGLDKNTVIVLMGDNGYFLGERQLAGKWLMYDNSIRVPLIIYDPRVENHKDIDEMAEMASTA